MESGRSRAGFESTNDVVVRVKERRGSVDRRGANGGATQRQISAARRGGFAVE
jgi:hypothetical protein